MSRCLSITALGAAAALLSALPAAANAQVIITQAKAAAGNVTPGDAAGFPVTITRAGSYQLASNLQPGVDKVGIEVAASNVTIDLNGFSLLGRDMASRGIYGTGAGRNVVIRNGIVSGFKLGGIDASAYAWTVDNMQVVQNGGGGVDLYNYGRVANSIITENGGTGVDCSWGCHVEGNVISDNGGDGVSFFYGGTVLGNTILGNDGVGVRGSNQGYMTGFGNNTIGSNGGGSRSGVVQALHPNLCDPAC